MIKENTQRLGYDLLVACLITALFFARIYESFPPAMQLVVLKMLITSMALIHAHIVGKLFFGTVDWKGEFRVHHIARLALYVTLPICYAISG